MERRRRLADLLAVPAGELLPHRLDYLPLARDHFQGLRYVLVQLAQARAIPARLLLENAACRPYPALVGRQVWRGFRQSMPSDLIPKSLPAMSRVPPIVNLPQAAPLRVFQHPASEPKDTSIATACPNPYSL